MKNHISKLPKQFRDLLYRTGKLAARQGARAYLVGGCVRDLILGLSNLDLDIVVQPDGAVFASELARQLKAKLIVHHRFGTATLVTPGKIKLDIATARLEIYPQPASLPVVTPATIKEDLIRRDFTINALAMDLSPGNFGGLVDFYHGRRDLQEKVIRILHGLSFIDDPTRIIRAVRFEQRLKFRIEPESMELLTDAAGAEMLKQVSAHRLRDELILFLKEPGAFRYILRLDKLAGLGFIHPQCRLSKKNLRYLAVVEKEANWFSRVFPRGRTLDVWLMYLAGLLDGLSRQQIKQFCRKFGLRKGEEKRILSFNSFSLSRAAKLSKRNTTPGEVYKILEPLSFEAILLIKAKYRNKPLNLNIEKFIRHYNGIRLYLSGRDLHKSGLNPGPQYKKILNQLLYLQLEGKINSRRGALNWIKRFSRPRV
ncbi:CCA tRNA nucleotidyltransferase [Candidatus Omnitrophota bacterium]